MSLQQTLLYASKLEASMLYTSLVLSLLVASARAGHDSWGCVEDWSQMGDGSIGNFCVVGMGNSILGPDFPSAAATDGIVLCRK